MYGIKCARLSGMYVYTDMLICLVEVCYVIWCWNARVEFLKHLLPPRRYCFSPIATCTSYACGTIIIFSTDGHLHPVGTSFQLTSVLMYPMSKRLGRGYSVWYVCLEEVYMFVIWLVEMWNRVRMEAQYDLTFTASVVCILSRRHWSMAVLPCTLHCGLSVYMQTKAKLL